MNVHCQLIGCHDMLNEVLEEQQTAEKDRSQDGTLQSGIVESTDDRQSSEVGVSTRENKTLYITSHGTTSYED